MAKRVGAKARIFKPGKLLPPEGFHFMPDGSLMKNIDHKNEPENTVASLEEDALGRQDYKPSELESLSKSLDKVATAADELNLPDFDDAESAVFNDNALHSSVYGEIANHVGAETAAMMVYYLGNNPSEVEAWRNLLLSGNLNAVYAKIGALGAKVEAAKQSLKAKKAEKPQHDPVVTEKGDASANAVQSKLDKLAQTDPQAYVKAMREARRAARNR